MHVGYEQRAEYALREVLGNDYLSRDTSLVTFRPWLDVPTDSGWIEHQPIPRVAIVIEGEASKLAPVLEALDRMREAL